jgi:cytoskeletal protein CcmA (bactofilin family)
MSGTTIVDVGVRIRGEVSGPGDVRIRGRVEGRIHVSGAVKIEEGGVAAADIVAARVRIDGLLEGRIRASRQVSIGATGRLVGDVWGLLAVDEGGVFEGRIVTDSDDALTVVPSSRAPRERPILRVDPEISGPIRLPTKRRVTQPSLGVIGGAHPSPAPPRAAPSVRATASGSFDATTDPGSAALRTPKRLTATPREPALRTPVLDEAPPPAPSTARLPKVRDEDIARRTAPPPAPATRTPPAPAAPAAAETPPPGDPAPRRDAHPAGAPVPSPPERDEDLEDRWFEEADFLVKRAEASGEHPPVDEGRGPGSPPASKKRRRRP